MFRKEEEKVVRQRLVTVYDYAVVITLSGQNGEEEVISAVEMGRASKSEAATRAERAVYSSNGCFFKVGKDTFLSTNYYRVSKIVATEIDSRQVLVDV